MSAVAEPIKRVISDEHKIKMKEGRERAAAEKLESDKKLLAKLQKKIEKKLETVTKKDVSILAVNEDPVNDVKEEDIKPEVTEKILKVKSEVKEEKVKPEVKEVKEEKVTPEVKEEKVKKVKPEVKEEKVKKVKPDVKEEKVKKVKSDVKEVKPEVKELKSEVNEVKPEVKPSISHVPLIDNTEDSEIEEREVQFMTKKKAIPKHVKTLVWNKYIGGDKAKAACMSCRQEEIGIRSFHCGHVIAESKGGDMTINNLRPICAACNGSMGTMSMNEFTSQFFGWSI